MLRITRARKLVKDQVILDVEQLEVGSGEIVAIVGPIGSALTMLTQAVCGEIALSGGKITIGDHDAGSLAARQHLGVLFADDLLYDRQTVWENLELIAFARDLPATHVWGLLSEVGLKDQATVRVKTLTSAQQRRLAFARALLAQPGLVLLERPIARTDLPTQALMRQIIQDLATANVAVLIIDDDLTWCSRFAHRLFLLEDGRIIGPLLSEEAGATTPATTSPASQDQTTAISADLPALATEQDAAANAAPPTVESTARLSLFKVPARKDDRIVLFDPAEILYATSRDGKTYLRTVAEEAMTNLTLQELETRLVPRGFFKAHRAYLVNLQHIRAVIQFTRNSYSLQLDDTEATLIPLSKQSEKALQAMLDY